jgi:hypothetical protein
MSYRAIAAIFPVILFASFAPAQTRAPLDPEPNAPYRWQVGLRCANHPVLSATVRQQLARELRAALQATLDTAGEVEVVDFTNAIDDKHAVLKAFAERGWAALEPDPLRELTGFKTHILTVDYKDGVFHLATRQLDGFTGIASPIVRKQTCRSVDTLARIAALLVEPDFGPVGTLSSIAADDEHVKVTFRGTALANPSKWVRKGDVLVVAAVREITRPADPKNPLPKDFRGELPKMRTGVPYSFTLLKVEEKPDDTGTAKCAILSRFKDPWMRDMLARDARRRIGLRAMKLATIDAKVKLRLVGQDGSPHVKGSLIQVTGTDLDFNAQPGPEDVLKYESGTYRSGRVFNNVACIQVGLEGGRIELFPVPVLSEDPVLLRFDVKAEDEERAAFANECNGYRTKVADLVLSQRALFEKVNKFLDVSKNRDALATATGGQAAVIEAHKVLIDELKQLRERPRAGEEAIKKILDAGDKQLAAVEKGIGELNKTMGLLDEVAKKSDDPSKLEAEFRAKELAERIKDFRSRGDIPEALEAMEKLINLVPGNQAFKDEREKLQAEWTPKDDEHRKARDAMKKWATSKTYDEMKENAFPTKKAVEILVRKADKLGLRKLLNSFEPIYSALGKMVADTDGTTEEGTKTLAEMEKLKELIRVIEDDARIGLNKLVNEKK